MAMFLTSDLAARHGFFTRRGGVSCGHYDSLNCRLTGDDQPHHVEENRARVAAALGYEPEHLLTLYQSHTNHVVTLTHPFEAAQRPRADAMVTRTPGLVLGVLSADCTPILFHDDQADVIGAAHSGWKGTLHNIAGQTVAAMQALGATAPNITAAIGPCIAQASYEVGPEFHETFLQHDPALARFFTPSLKPGHFHYDLRSMIADQLGSLGVRVLSVANDTYAEADNFFSNRRAAHLGEPRFGLQISAIAL